MNTTLKVAEPWFKRVFGDFLEKFDPHTNGFVKHPVETVFQEYNHVEDNCTNNNAGNLKAQIIGLHFVPIPGNEDWINYCNENITEQLKELYAKVNENCKEEFERQFEVVQVCFPEKSPRFEDSTTYNYFKIEVEKRCVNIPWFALPRDGIERNIRLRYKYGIREGEYGLVLLDASSGKLITKRGHDRLLEDRMGRHFPWRPPHVLHILKNIPFYISGYQKDFKDDSKDFQTHTFQDIDPNAIIGLYFSAHWCPPCKAFTSQLIKTYTLIKESGQKFEIIFVSSDRGADSFTYYISKMPWLAIPFENTDNRSQLTSLYGIQGIPSLILLNPDGSVITEDGRGEINDDPLGTDFPWYPKPVNVLNGRLAAKFQKSPAIVLFTDGEEDVEIELATAVLTPVSEHIKKKFDDTLLFFIAVDSDISETLRRYLRIEDVSPLLTLVDFPLGRFAVMEYGKEITEKSIMNFVNQFFNNELTYLPIE